MLVIIPSRVIKYITMKEQGVDNNDVSGLKPSIMSVYRTENTITMVFIKSIV